MPHIYLVLAVVGAVVPYVFFIDYFVANGISLPGFAAGLFVNGAAGGFAADVLISSAVFWRYMFSMRRRSELDASLPEEPSPWPFVVLNLTIGLSCALPAWLWWRQRAHTAVAQPAA